MHLGVTTHQYTPCTQCHLLIIFANCLDPDKTWQKMKMSGMIWIQTIWQDRMVFLKDFFENVNERQNGMQNYTPCKELKPQQVFLENVCVHCQNTDHKKFESEICNYWYNVMRTLPCSDCTFFLVIFFLEGSRGGDIKHVILQTSKILTASELSINVSFSS